MELYRFYFFTCTWSYSFVNHEAYFFTFPLPLFYFSFPNLLQEAVLEGVTAQYVVLTKEGSGVSYRGERRLLEYQVWIAFHPYVISIPKLTLELYLTLLEWYCVLFLLFTISVEKNMSDRSDHSKNSCRPCSTWRACGQRSRNGFLLCPPCLFLLFFFYFHSPGNAFWITITKAISDAAIHMCNGHNLPFG